MSNSPSLEDIRRRLTALLRRAEGLHGDVKDPRVRGEVREIVRQAHTSAESLEENVSDTMRRIAFDLMAALSNRLTHLDAGGRWPA